MAARTSWTAGIAQRFRAFANPHGLRAEGTPRGARSGRRSALFEQNRQHLNAVIAGAGATLRGRVRFLIREGSYAGAMKRIWTDYAVGTGWTPVSLHPNAEVRAALNLGWKAWTDLCDYDGLTDYYGLQALIGDEEFEAGECFVRLHPDPDVGLRLQVIESEQLPYSNLPAEGEALAQGHEVRLGVEFNARGRRVAYHFYRQHPGDGTKEFSDARLLMRVPAEEILHIFRVRRPGQIRGYPQLAGAIVPNFKLEEYEDALLERAAQSAKYMGFITRAGGGNEDPTPVGSDGGAREYQLETGVLYEVDPEEKIEFNTPPEPGAGFDDMERRFIAKACAAVGVPYAEVSGDLKNANFSSARIGRQPLRRSVERWGHATLNFQFNRPVWAAWLRLGMLAGQISLPRGASRQIEAYLPVNWLPPHWEYVNPLDDVKADEIAVANGFKPRGHVIAATGYSPEEVDAQIADDQGRQDRLKLRIGSTKSQNAAASTTKPSDRERDGAPADAEDEEEDAAK